MATSMQPPTGSAGSAWGTRVTTVLDPTSGLKRCLVLPGIGPRSVRLERRGADALPFQQAWLATQIAPFPIPDFALLLPASVLFPPAPVPPTPVADDPAPPAPSAPPAPHPTSSLRQERAARKQAEREDEARAMALLPEDLTGVSLRALRVAAGLTQRAAATLVGCQRGRVYDLEASRRTLRGRAADGKLQRNRVTATWLLRYVRLLEEYRRHTTSTTEGDK